MFTLRPCPSKDIDPHLCFDKIYEGREKTLFIARGVLYVCTYHSTKITYHTIDGLTIYDAIISYDDSFIAVITSDNQLKIYDTQTGTEMFSTLTSLATQIASMIFSADNHQLICALKDESKLEIYQLDLKTKTPKTLTITNFLSLTEPAQKIRFAKEKELIVITRSNTIVCIPWELIEDRLASDSTFSPTGSYLPYTARQLYQTSTTVLSSTPAVIHHVQKLLVIWLNCGTIIAFNNTDYTKLRVLHYMPICHYMTDQDYQENLGAHSTQIIFCNLDTTDVMHIKFSIDRHETVTFTLPLPTKKIQMNKKIMGAPRYEKLPLSPLKPTAEDGANANNIPVYFSEQGWEIKKLQYYTTLHGKPEKELAAVLSSPAARPTNEDEFKSVYFGMLQRYLATLTVASLPIKTLLLWYRISPPFKLQQSYINSVYFSGGHIYTNLFLIDSNEPNAMRYLDTTSPIKRDECLKRTKIIFAIFKLQAFNFHIDEFSEEKTWQTFLNPSFRSIIKDYDLLVPAHLRGLVN